MKPNEWMQRRSDRKDRVGCGMMPMSRLRRTALAIGVAAVLMANALIGNAAVIAGNGSESGSAARTFSDVNAGQWFEPFVSELAETGVISGYPDGSFRPQSQVTTGQFLAMIVQTGQRCGAWEAPATGRADQQTIAGSSAANAHWARPFYDAALEAELLFRDELPPTSLDQPISRLWMAVISSRMMPENNAGASDTIRHHSTITVTSATSITATNLTPDIAPEDIDERQPYSYEILMAYEAGLLSGYPDGTFRPQGYLTRAEAATVIYKLNAMLDDDAVRQNSTREPETPSPAFGYDPVPVDMAAGTKLFWYRLPLEGGQAGTIDLAKLKPVMVEQLTTLGSPNGNQTHGAAMADDLYTSFKTFAEKALAHQREGRQGLRKEYVGGYPVLMEAVDGEIRIYVKPRGSETRFWGVEQGRIFEEFF